MSAPVLADPPTTARPTTGARPPARARPRTSLPSGRAVVGGLLVTVAALGTFVAATGGDSGPSGRYVVAARPVDPGERLDPGDLTVVAGELPADVAGTTFATPDALHGAVVLSPLVAGSLVQQADVRRDPAETDDPSPEISLRLPRAQAVDGEIVRGEWVDVLATYGSGADAATHVIARDALVIGIGQEDRAGLGDDGGITLTLRLADDATVLRTIHAKDVATVTLVRSTTGTGAPSTGPDRYGGPPGDADPPTTEVA